ncbi:response regulator [Sphingomonas prati]|uniref:DNA-binding NarL/FixJ family response regulator n=1 Tax=Sphingomonas prati TaxID=1843237 RepID=A0A7W9BTI1_9SPHN|nr:response regulator [Sphingomonas prati]MBB5729669.1 DNA-binding NarL/FixJ family response regulator [Sphingomonas prati]GGE90376.1 response regulator [Sphingomonas prati]
MTELTLKGCSILVVEDEYLLAEELSAALAAESVQVVGPAATVEQGTAFLRDTPRLNGAILDVNLRGEPVFDLADMLAEQGVPFMFTTGYDASIIPDRFTHVARYEKPLRMSQIIKTMGQLSYDMKV